MDLRVLKTKRAIRTALLELLSRKSISDVTVKELCEKAEVSKPAFYYHYRNAYEVLCEIEDEAIERMMESISRTEVIDFCSESFLRAFGRCVFDSPLSAALSKDELSADFIRRMSTSLGAKFGMTQAESQFNKRALAVRFAFNGLLGMMGALGKEGYNKAIPMLSELMCSSLATAKLA